MSGAVAKVMKEAESLTENEKSELALFLIQSLDKKENKDHDALWRQEIIRRDEALANGTAKTVSWSEIQARFE